MKKYCCILLALVLTACGGGGSSPSNPVVTVQPFAAPAPASTATTPTCTNPHTSEYPAIYNGYRPTPTPQQRLPVTFQRGISFKDYYPGWIYDNAKGTIKCTKDEYVKLMYTQALDNIQSSGATMFWIYNFGYWDSVDAKVMTMQKNTYHIPEYIVEFIVQEAKKRNLQVYFAWQFTPSDVNNKHLLSLGDHISVNQLNTIMDSHHQQMIDTAKVAQRIGISGLAADWNAMNIGNLHDPILREIYVTKISKIIDDVRANYSGKITYGQDMRPVGDPRIVDKVDALHFSLGGGILTKNENVNLSPELIKDAILKEIYSHYLEYKCVPPHDSFRCGSSPSTKNIPVYFEIQVQSRDDYWVTGWKEDGFCVPGTTVTGSTTPCIQDTYVTDFSVQSIGIEGILRAVVAQREFNVIGVNFHTSYWHSDSLKPGYEGFPNVSQSIRGKPAEKIVKYWYTGS